MSQQRWDKDECWQVVDHQVKATGRVCDFVDDAVVTPSGEQINRQYMSHPGAVGIIALDDQDRVAVVRQYRHPVRMVLVCLLYTSPSPRDATLSRMPSSA